MSTGTNPSTEIHKPISSKRSTSATADLPRSLDDLPPILTLQQTARVLAVDRRTIYAAIRRRDLRAFKIGNAYRIERAVLLSFIRADRSHHKRR